MSADDAARGWSQLFKAAFERSSNSMILLERDRTIVRANEACLELVGYSCDEFVGRHADDFVTPRSRPQMVSDWKTLLSQGTVSGERDLYRRDGDTLRVQFAAQTETVTGQQFVLWVVVTVSCVEFPDCVGARDLPELSPREREVISHIAIGQRVHEVANDLFISPSTVNTHVRNAMQKLGARSQAQLVAITMAHCILDRDTIRKQLEQTSADE